MHMLWWYLHCNQELFVACNGLAYEQSLNEFDKSMCNHLFGSVSYGEIKTCQYVFLKIHITCVQATLLSGPASSDNSAAQ